MGFWQQATDSFGSQIELAGGMEEDTGLQFTSPQGRKFSAGTLGIWPAGKNSHWAACGPEENYEPKCFHKSPIWFHRKPGHAGCQNTELNHAQKTGWKKWFTKTPYPPKEDKQTWTPGLQTLGHNSLPAAQHGRLEEKQKRSVLDPPAPWSSPPQFHAS